VTIAEVQKLSGHKSIASLMRYAHLEQNATAATAVDILNKQNAEPGTGSGRTRDEMGTRWGEHRGQDTTLLRSGATN
jgi:hypothetical protein